MAEENSRQLHKLSSCFNVEVFYGTERSGKTYEAIKCSAETGAVIVCINQNAADHLLKFAKHDIPRPISAHIFKKMSKEERPKRIILDPAEAVLPILLDSKIDVITITKDTKKVLDKN